MQKHLLVAVNDAAASLSLRFVFDFFANRDELELTLYYVAPKKEPDAFKAQAISGTSLAPAIDPAGIPAMEQAKNWLLSMGYPAGNIHAKAAHSDMGVVKDIAHECEEGLYDAAVLGRRGLSWFEEVFAYSVSHRILWERIAFPLWICRNPEKGRKNVLICVDGSEGSLRVADHVGFILRDEPNHAVTLLHVETDRYSPIENIFERPRQMLLENGFPEDRIETRSVASKNPTRTIVSEAKSFAAVAIGRTSGRPTAFGHIFGTTSLKILRSLEGAALWLCK